MNEIAEIKRLARGKRVDYASAPMGTGVFNLIQRQSQEIRFELVSFESEKIDGMLYIPTSWQERASFIIVMTVKYQMPLKAVIYRLAEEKYIGNVKEYIVNDFVSQEDEVSEDEMDDEELFSIINAKRG